ncbi:MAG: CBS domain-containing protein [Candidatus Manganitrophaceae bacterium]
MRGTNYLIGGKSLWEMEASHLMEREVVFFDGMTSCHLIAETLVQRNFGSVPIVDEDKLLIGIVSEYDILKALAEGKNLETTPAVEVMSPAVSISETMGTKEIINLLEARHFIRVPVVDDQKRLIGIVARRDILAGYLDSTYPPHHGGL